MVPYFDKKGRVRVRYHPWRLSQRCNSSSVMTNLQSDGKPTQWWWVQVTHLTNNYLSQLGQNITYQWLYVPFTWTVMTCHPQYEIFSVIRVRSTDWSICDSMHQRRHFHGTDRLPMKLILFSFDDLHQKETFSWHRQTADWVHTLQFRLSVSVMVCDSSAIWIKSPWLIQFWRWVVSNP